MDNFNLKDWILENKIGKFGKAQLTESIQEDSDKVEFDASDFPVTEARSYKSEMKIEDAEMNILGNTYIVDADVDYDVVWEDEERVDHMIISPSGYVVDDFTLVLTNLQKFDDAKDDFVDVPEGSERKQIENILNTDRKYRFQIMDIIEDEADLDNVDFEPDLDEKTKDEQIGVGYVMKTKPSDPKY